MRAVVLKSFSIVVFACSSFGCAGSGSGASPAGIAGIAAGPRIEVFPDDAAPTSTSIPGDGAPLIARPVPGGTLDGREIAPFHMAATETTWDEYLALVTEADDAAAAESIDGFARPSKPYISMDRGFGQQTRPVISISPRGAEAYVRWLSARTGRAWRLPTADEWRFAAAIAQRDSTAALERRAWHAGNSGGASAPVGTSAADALGLHDLLGNAAEWCSDGAGGHVLAGGSYRDSLEHLAELPLVRPIPAWNASDPQIPKSTWWLADAGFPGLRLVHD